MQAMSHFIMNLLKLLNQQKCTFGVLTGFPLKLSAIIYNDHMSKLVQIKFPVQFVSCE